MDEAAIVIAETVRPCCWWQREAMKNAMVVGASALRQGLRIGFSDCGFTSNSTLGVTKRALKIEVGLLEGADLVLLGKSVVVLDDGDAGLVAIGFGCGWKRRPPELKPASRTGGGWKAAGTCAWILIGVRRLVLLEEAATDGNPELGLREADVG
ncbi:hypothetical protein ACLB2K_060074 [Fragaria x ananassa]